MRAKAGRYEVVELSNNSGWKDQVTPEHLLGWRLNNFMGSPVQCLNVLAVETSLVGNDVCCPLSSQRVPVLCGRVWKRRCISSRNPCAPSTPGLAQPWPQTAHPIPQECPAVPTLGEQQERDGIENLMGNSKAAKYFLLSKPAL